MHKKLNLSKLNQDDLTIISSAEGLKDVESFDWGDDIEPLLRISENLKSMERIKLGEKNPIEFIPCPNFNGIKCIYGGRQWDGNKLKRICKKDGDCVLYYE